MKYRVLYNNQHIGKLFKTKKEAVKEVKRLIALNLYGYTVSKI